MIRSGNAPQKAFQCISDAARVAKHVVTVVECERDNTEDPTFSAQLEASNKEINAGEGREGGRKEFSMCFRVRERERA